jgi:hypothetical protein
MKEAMREEQERARKYREEMEDVEREVEREMKVCGGREGARGTGREDEGVDKGKQIRPHYYYISPFSLPPSLSLQVPRSAVLRASKRPEEDAGAREGEVEEDQRVLGRPQGGVPAPECVSPPPHARLRGKEEI